MKALFSEEYYRQYWYKFLEKVPGDDYINLEEELEKEMSQYWGSWVTENVRGVLETVEAQKIVKRCEELVKKEMKVVKEVEAGKASFGMMTQAQEIKARGDFRKRFEFNCLQLADFKKKYL